MDKNRIISALLILVILIFMFVIGNKYIVDVLLSFVAFLSIDEYFNAISKVSNPVRWIGYISCLSIACIHLIPQESITTYAILALPIILIILFAQVVATEMKTSFKDIAYTFLGIFYVVFFTMFIALIQGMDKGKILIWYTFGAAWGSDIFAYLIGKYFGKHKFSKVSPKKSIEGCIAGVVGAVALMLLFTYFANTYWGLNVSYWYIALIGVALSLLGQIGDFAASSIKRYVDIKDYSNLIPGHGGMLDRIDSLIFLAPFAYVLLSLI
ncbi:MAG: phosphatidate cytidylyltransferase [Clostridia bacterium]|nr:phosphatidate cytidylyltransferase [Clostridia bacterium]